MDAKNERAEQELLARMADAATRCERTGRPVFTRFLNPAQQLAASRHVSKRDVTVSTWGGYEDAERRMLCLSQFETDAFPIDCLVVRSTDGKVFSHRDYLGSVLALGLDRECIGDIVVREEDALIFCAQNISEFLTLELTRVGHMPVHTGQTDIENLVVERKTKTSTATVSSLRLDCVVAAFAHLSRTDAATLIERGMVQVNYEVCEKCARPLGDGDTLSARGHGKFKLHVSDRLSKKGRIHIQMEQYI